MLIELTSGSTSEIDDSDSWVAKFRWNERRSPKEKTTYAVATVDGKRVSLHRLIMGLTDPKIQVDHRDRNGLNNKRSNLRIATKSQNMANRGPDKNNTSGFKGVHSHTKKGYSFWRAEITVNRKRIALGQRVDKEKAARLYDEAAVKYFGEFAVTNFPQK